MFKCYVAGKLNDDAVGYIKNMHRMIKTARELRKLGIAVYVPGNDFLEGLVDGNFCGETDEDHAVAVFFNIMAYEATLYKVKNK